MTGLVGVYGILAVAFFTGWASGAAIQWGKRLLNAAAED